MDIEMVPLNSLRPAPWRATYTLKPDLKTLEDSILSYGWISPIVGHRATGYIVDGFHRWVLAQSSKKITTRDNGLVPVVWLDCDEIDAMVAHIRMNRGRGMLVPRFLSSLVRTILRSNKFSEKELKSELRMGVDEFGLLLDGTLFKQKNIAEHVYSKSWVPIESNGKDVPIFERPPNSDR